MKFLDEMKHKNLRKYLHERMTEKRIKPPMLATDYVRASGIYEFCPREEFLVSKYNISREDVIPERLWKTFNFGRVFEKCFRDEFLGDTGILIGKWKCMICTHCEESVNGMTRYIKPTECFVCGGNSFSYVEEDILSPDGLLGGHPDGFIHWDGRYSILELKTANDMNFNKVRKEPMPRHVAQVQIYMLLTGYLFAQIFYFNKDSSEDLCHEVVFDEVQAKSWQRKAEEWRESVITGKSPDRTCLTSDCPRAKKCQVRQLCFSI